MKVAIIGGSGKMGRWLADFLVKDGREVVISGRNKEKLLATGHQLGVKAVSNNMEAVSGSDYVLLSVPVDNLEEIVRQLGPHIKSGQARCLIMC